MNMYEVKFDRNEMRDLVSNYFEAIMKVDPKVPGHAKELLSDFLTEDYICREGDWPTLRSKNNWIQRFENYTPTLKCKYYYKKPDGYMAIDTRIGMVGCYIRHELMNSEGRVVSSCYWNLHVQVVRDADGKLRIRREVRHTVPTLLSGDYFEAGKEGLACWMYSDKQDDFREDKKAAEELDSGKRNDF